jgi:hypothetical protein
MKDHPSTGTFPEPNTCIDYVSDVLERLRMPTQATQ